MSEVEGWARSWLLAQRASGKVGYEIKKLNNTHYVYHSTTIWLKDEKKRKKVSKYLGKLDPELGLLEGVKRTALEAVRITSVKERGNAQLLDVLFQDILPTLEGAFPRHWREIYALALLRALNVTPMYLAESRWEKILDVRDVRPRLDPKSLSLMLDEVGLDRTAQTELFGQLAMKGEQLIYDLSCFFSRSEELNLAEKGRNHEHIHVPQVNVALLCDAASGLPVMIRALPGSIRDVATIYACLEELDLKDKILILDRGFFGENVVQLLVEKGLSFVMPARRNSELYEHVELGEGEFLYHDRLIHFGKSAHANRFLYRFEDTEMRVQEEKNLAKLVFAKKLTKAEKDERMCQVGHILIESDLDRTPEDIYLLYKRRDRVEKLFETWKSTLQADRTWLRSDASVFGHIFISFVSLYLLARLELALRSAGMLQKMSARQVLEEYSKAYVVQSEGIELNFEVPKKVRDLDKRLGFNLFPILRK
jgi:transposase